MPFKLKYFRYGALLGERQWMGSPHKVQKIAEDGLIVHEADLVKVLDDQGEETFVIARAPSPPISRPASAKAVLSATSVVVSKFAT
jgi:hypothetical protein